MDTLLRENKKLEKTLKQQALAAASGEADRLLDSRRDVGGVPVITADVGEQPMDMLRGMMDGLRSQFDSGVIVLGSASNGKACFMASVSKDLTDRGVHAGKLIGQVAKIAGGGGGGQPQKAQAGARDGTKVGEAIRAVDDLLAAMVS